MSDSFINPLSKFEDNTQLVKQIKKLSWIGFIAIMTNLSMIIFFVHAMSINNNNNSTPLITDFPETEMVYPTAQPELSSAPSKHVINLMEFGGMEDEFKDNILNNLDSIIVTDGDIGTSRHQISKVSWLFDDADTMLLYSSLGEIFALASNGTISEYSVANGARRLLQSQTGWLEGKVSDVVHYGSEYADMKQQGKHYLKTRDNKRKLSKANDEFISLNDRIEEAESKGEDTKELTEKLEKVRETKEVFEVERSRIPIVQQRPVERKTVDDELRAQEIERMEKEFEETKAEEVIKYREEVTAQKEVIRQELDSIRIQLNETHHDKIKMEEELVETIREKIDIEENLATVTQDKIDIEVEIEQVRTQKQSIIQELNTTRETKGHEMESIKLDLDTTKAEIEEARQTLATLIETEEDPDKIQIFNEMNIKLQDTSGKLSFTQIQIEEDTIREYDDFRVNHSEYDGDYSREHWNTEKLEDMDKSCKHLRPDDPEPVCVCTDRDSREVMRC